MKKIFTLFAAAVVALMAIGCEPVEPTNENQLVAPEFSANANENSITVSWVAVEGAAYYQIQLNDAEPVKTDKTVHRFDNLK